MRVEQHETETSTWAVARRDPPPHLRPYLLAGVEGWAQTRGAPPHLREVPFAGLSPTAFRAAHLESGGTHA